jgi:hypothetical protein
MLKTNTELIIEQKVKEDNSRILEEELEKEDLSMKETKEEQS